MEKATERSELVEWARIIRRLSEACGVPPAEPFERPARDPNAPRVKYVLSEAGKRMRREMSGRDRDTGK